MAAIGPDLKKNITKHHNIQIAAIVEIMFRYTLGVRSIMKKHATLVLELFYPKIRNLRFR